MGYIHDVPRYICQYIHLDAQVYVLISSAGVEITSFPPRKYFNGLVHRISITWRAHGTARTRRTSSSARDITLGALGLLLSQMAARTSCNVWMSAILVAEDRSLGWQTSVT